MANHLIQLKVSSVLPLTMQGNGWNLTFMRELSTTMAPPGRIRLLSISCNKWLVDQQLAGFSPPPTQQKCLQGRKTDSGFH